MGSALCIGKYARIVAKDSNNNPQHCGRGSNKRRQLCSQYRWFGPPGLTPFGQAE